MSRKDRKNLSSIMAGLFGIIALYLYFFIFKSNNFYILLVILFLAVVLDIIIYNLLPNKKLKKKKQSRKNVKRVTSNVLVSPNRLLSDDKILTLSLGELSWREFERLCFLYFKAKGYNPSETSEGADGGIDLVIYNKKHRTKEAVQIKHYIHSGNQITVKEIRELNTSKRNYDCILSMFITTSTFTKNAFDEAEKFKIDCRDIYWVKDHIVKWKEEEARKLKLVKSSN